MENVKLKKILKESCQINFSFKIYFQTFQFKTQCTQGVYKNMDKGSKGFVQPYSDKKIWRFSLCSAYTINPIYLQGKGTMPDGKDELIGEMFTISNVNRHHAGVYRCSADNGFSKEASKVIFFCKISKYG